MQPLYHELTILTKALHYKNLSAAALHVGLSQPQLSRIIARIEEEYKIILLDRSAKRKSGWTQVAFRLAEIFEKSHRRLEHDLLGVSRNQIMSELRIGTLEGLSSLSLKTAHLCFNNVGIHKISLDIYDTSELEAHFLSGNLDLIFTSKAPSKQKFKYYQEIGYQKFDRVETDVSFGVFSTFEYGHRPAKERTRFKHVLISNSLSIKKEWFRTVGGTGSIPGEPQKNGGKDADQVLMIGSELLSPLLWEQLLDAVPIPTK